MKKLIQGIMDFRRTRREGRQELMAKLALGQQPDALFVACSDSRVAANVFASTDPGDLFVVRNLGNMIPMYPDKGSTVAALEYALEVLKVGHIIVCGHSDCGAIAALSRSKGGNHEPAEGSPLTRWIRHAAPLLESGPQDVNSLSKRNVALQIEHLQSHPLAKKLHEAGKLRFHGLWFDIRQADVHYLERDKFTLIDDEEGGRILKRLES
jgi:carbonic anhydrase